MGALKSEPPPLKIPNNRLQVFAVSNLTFLYESASFLGSCVTIWATVRSSRPHQIDHRLVVMFILKASTTYFPVSGLFDPTSRSQSMEK